MKKIKIFKSRENLINSIELNMPDEYPRGYAVFLANKMIENKEVIIID